jgi:Holliday junction resolvase
VVSVTAYADGRRFEYKTRTHLRGEGYEVTRAASSKTKLDLVAMKPGELLFVQCKRDGDCGPAEWDRLVELAEWVGAVPILAVNGPAGRGIVYWRLVGPKRRNVRFDQQRVVRFYTDHVVPV